MEQEIDQAVQAIGIASDPAQIALHQQALAYIATIQQNSATTWRLALQLFTAKNPDGSKKYPPQARFFALRVMDDFFESRSDSLDEETFQTLQQTLVSYIQSEYVHGSAEADATFLRNKFSHTLTLFFLCVYIDKWPTFFADLFTLIRPTQSPPPSSFNRHVSLLFFHIVLEISGEVADQMIKSARSYNAARVARDTRVRDAVRERDAARINEAVLTIVAQGTERMNNLQKRKDETSVGRELDEAIEVVDWGVRTFGSYVGWIDINLTVTPTTVPLLFSLLADSSLPIRLASSVALLRIVAKGLKEPGDKLQLLKVLALGQVLDALEAKTRQQQIQRGSDVDEGEESYRESLGKLLNVYGVELTKLVDECLNDSIRAEASDYLSQIQPVMLRFMADEYDDTCSTIFPLLQIILTSYKRARKTSTEPIDGAKRSFLESLLKVMLTKMKWDPEADPDDADEDDNAEFEKLRKELRNFMDHVLAIDQDLVTKAVQTLALNTIAAFREGISLQWHDAELGIYLVYIFGEINKTGGKGRAAFCQAPAVDRDKRREVNYADYPLTPHGEMLLALVQSGISSYPNRTVALQYFETVARYIDFFKIRKECIIPTLEAMIDSRGMHNDNVAFRSRLSYLFYRFIKEGRNDISPDIAPTIIGGIRDLLSIQIELPEFEEGEPDILAEAVKSTVFDSQLYLFETTGILCSLLFKIPAQQAPLLLSLIQPLMDELAVNLQASTKGDSDLIPIVKVHHIIMALGNVAKGFPDHPSPVPEGYIHPPVEVFAQMAQAILRCLEAMNVFKVIREATRFAFARIIATAGPHVTHFIPPLMSNLLAQFEPSELVDFMNFIALLVFKLGSDMFDVLDQLIGPLSVHLAAIFSEPVSGTDEQRAQMDTKKGWLALLNSIISAGQQGVFISSRNMNGFETLMATMESLVADVSDPVSQKAALLFLIRCVATWGQPPATDKSDGGAKSNVGLPGFERFMFENLVPVAFRVPASAGFNIKDGQMMVVLHEIANLLQAICKARGPEAYNFFPNIFLPSQNWPPETALDFTTKLRDLDGKAFRKYFTEFVRSSRAS